MTRFDRWGARTAAPSGGAAALFDNAVLDLCLMTGQPSSILNDLVDVAPAWALPRVALSYLDLYAQTMDGNRAAFGRLEEAEQAGADRTPREQAHATAARQWHDGGIAGAIATLTGWLTDEPRDLLALRICQDLAFFSGDRAALLAAPSRALGAWASTESERGIVAGMVAFGLEEHGQYAEAETTALGALAVNPGDPWSVHAFAHVLEMQGRSGEGDDFLRSGAPHWSPSFFASHNWWHLALFCIERDDLSGAVDLLHGPIDATSPTVWFEVVNQVSLRWRLSLLDIDVDLPAALVEVLVDRADEHLSIFNDLHAVAGLALAGESGAVERVISGYGAGTARPEAGALLRGFADFAAGDYGAAARHLGTAQAMAPTIGGSNAQRDLVDQTLLLATVRSGGPAAHVDELVATHPSRWSSATTERLLTAP